MHALRREALASTLSQTKVIVINGVKVFVFLVYFPHNTELSSSISDIHAQKCIRSNPVGKPLAWSINLARYPSLAVCPSPVCLNRHIFTSHIQVSSPGQFTNNLPYLCLPKFFAAE